MIVSKYVLFLAIVANAGIAMERPLYKPPFRKNQPVRSSYNRRAQIPAIQVNRQEVVEVTKPQDPIHLFDYFKTLSNFETKLNELVTNAKEYQTAHESLVKMIHDNSSLGQEDKTALFKRFEQELKDKFFPQRVSPIRRSVTGN